MTNDIGPKLQFKALFSLGLVRRRHYASIVHENVEPMRASQELLNAGLYCWEVGKVQ